MLTIFAWIMYIATSGYFVLLLLIYFIWGKKVYEETLDTKIKEDRFFQGLAIIFFMMFIAGVYLFGLF